jgi:hypothetical protein
MPEETKTCPRCGSRLIVRIANTDHCNQCSCDFNLDRSPIATRAHDARRDAIGFPKRTT